MSYVIPGPLPSPLTITTGIQVDLGVTHDITMCIFNSDGTPNTTSTPAGGHSFSAYRYRDGTSPVSNPSINHKGGGRWTFTPIQAHIDAGVAFVVDFGALAYPRYFYGAVCGEDNPFGVVVPFNGNSLSGDFSNAPKLSTGRGLYTDLTGANRTPPTPFLADGSPPIIWVITPSSGDLDVGILMRMGSANLGVIHPDSIDLRLIRGTVAPTPADPVVALVSPPEGALDSDGLIVVDVTSADPLAVLILTILLPGISSNEVVYRAGAFGPSYTGVRNIVTTISGGYRFKVVRNGGWPPGGVTFSADVVTTSGAEADE